ncbi:putative amidohydrolase [Desulfitispora alkaliphila]|uniref:nitrilase-related carbon-nitrogen hydrolase n=1 Tax=Desulfitispora alkaliphila TaxID=622674 RepID=UPI003D1C37CD
MNIRFWLGRYEGVAKSEDLLKTIARRIHAVGAGGDTSCPQLLVLPSTSIKLSQPEADKLIAEISEMAAQASLYIVPGSLLVKEKSGEIKRQSVMISPQGQVVLLATQTHLQPEERELGLQQGTDISIGETEFGKVAILLHTDIFIPELWRIYALKGVKLMVCLSAVQKPYTHWKQLSGAWQNVQQNQVFALESALGGEHFEKAYEGKVEAYGPCEITPGEEGFLEQESAAENLATGKVQLGELEQVRAQYPLLQQLNAPLYNQWLPRIYRGDFS